MRQAGSYVGPDKLRFDFTHGAPLTPRSCAHVEDRVNEWILANQPVRALTTTLDEARSLGAMALFGEKYGDVVRMVEVGDGSLVARAVRRHARALHGGDRRVQDHDGDLERGQRAPHRGGHRARRRSRCCAATTACCATPPRRCARTPDARRRRGADREAKRRELEKQLRAGAARRSTRPSPTTRSEHRRRARGRSRSREVADPKALPDLADRLKNQLGDPAVVVLGAPGEGRVSLIVAATPGAVERGVKAGAVVKAAAQVVGGGGGGRDTMAQAGGRDPEKLPDALAAARAEIERALGV